MTREWISDLDRWVSEEAVLCPGSEFKLSTLLAGLKQSQFSGGPYLKADIDETRDVVESWSTVFLQLECPRSSLAKPIDG